MKMIETSKTSIAVYEIQIRYKVMVHLSIISLGEYRAFDLQDCTLPAVSDWASR